MLVVLIDKLRNYFFQTEQGGSNTDSGSKIRVYCYIDSRSLYLVLSIQKLMFNNILEWEETSLYFSR